MAKEEEQNICGARRVKLICKVRKVFEAPILTEMRWAFIYEPYVMPHLVYNNLKEKQTIGNTIETEQNARIAEYSIFGPIFDRIIANFWLRGYPVLYICGALVASTETLPTDPSSVIVTVSPIEIVSVTASVGDSPPPLEVVNKSVAMLEDRELELEITVVVNVSDMMLEVGELLPVEVSIVVDVPTVVPGPGGGGLTAGGTFGIVVFRAGLPEDPASRRTGQ